MAGYSDLLLRCRKYGDILVSWSISRKGTFPNNCLENHTHGREVLLRAENVTEM
jgi:hypothetical protein